MKRQRQRVVLVPRGEGCYRSFHKSYSTESNCWAEMMSAEFAKNSYTHLLVYQGRWNKLIKLFLPEESWAVQWDHNEAGTCTINLCPSNLFILFNMDFQDPNSTESFIISLKITHLLIPPYVFLRTNDLLEDKDCCPRLRHSVLPPQLKRCQVSDAATHSELSPIWTTTIRLALHENGFQNSIQFC